MHVMRRISVSVSKLGRRGKKSLKFQSSYKNHWLINCTLNRLLIYGYKVTESSPFKNKLQIGFQVFNII